MNRLEVNAEVGNVVQRRADICGHCPPARRRSRADDRCSRSPASARGARACLKCSEGTRDDRPRMCVRRRLACEVSGIEFLVGGVDVLEVECDARHDPLVGVDLDDAQNLQLRIPRWSAPRVRHRARRSPRVAMTTSLSKTVTPAGLLPTSKLATSASRPCRIPRWQPRRRSSLRWSSASISSYRIPVAGGKVRPDLARISGFAAFSNRGVSSGEVRRSARVQHRGLPRRIARCG